MPLNKRKQQAHKTLINKIHISVLSKEIMFLTWKSLIFSNLLINQIQSLITLNQRRLSISRDKDSDQVALMLLLLSWQKTQVLAMQVHWTVKNNLTMQLWTQLVFYLHLFLLPQLRILIFSLLLHLIVRLLLHLLHFPSPNSSKNLSSWWTLRSWRPNYTAISTLLSYSSRD